MDSSVADKNTSCKSALLGMTYEVVGNRSKVSKDKTVIYAITHIGKCDYEMVVEACNIFAYPFAGDWEKMYATIEDYFLRMNGVLYVDLISCKFDKLIY